MHIRGVLPAFTLHFIYRYRDHTVTIAVRLGSDLGRHLSKGAIGQCRRQKPHAKNTQPVSSGRHPDHPTVWLTLGFAVVKMGVESSL